MRRRDLLAAGLPFALQARPPRFGDGRDWFFGKRFGLFVHWGIYSIPAWHEQHLYRRKMSRAEYAPLMKQFNPVKYDPDAWLDMARDAGMEYVCFTTKHIDGFSMWDTSATGFKVTNTPYGRDTLKMLADACHRRGFPLCLYYSIVDENQPNYPNQGRPYELPAPAPGDQPDEEKYMAFLKQQVRELCTRYGAIHGFWWDANSLKRRDPSVNAMIRSLQPNAVINNRGFDDGDFSTPERDYDKSVGARAPFDRPVEACEAIGYQSWGYRTDEDYFTEDYLIRGMQRIFAKGGNYLLNVGPKADGTMPGAGVSTLRRIGQWYKAVKESFTGVELVSEMTRNEGVLLTKRGRTIYVHVVREPETSSIFLHPMATAPLRATLLNTGAPVGFDVDFFPRLYREPSNRSLRLKNLPVGQGSTAGWVIKLEFS